MSAYLDLVGYRLLDGFDICELTRPSCRTRSCARSASAVGCGPQDTDIETRTAEVRAKVPDGAPGGSSTSCSARRA